MNFMKRARTRWTRNRRGKNSNQPLNVMHRLFKCSYYLLLAGVFTSCVATWGQNPKPDGLLPEKPVVLKPLWRISFGNDYATTTDPSEMRQHDASGLLYYLAANPTDPKGERLQPVYRLISPDHKDHM